MNQRYKNNERIFDAVLSEALLEYVENELNELEESPCEHTFSPGFDKKIAKLAKGISGRERAKAVLKGTLRAATSVACVLGVLFMIFLTQPKVYAAVNNVVKIPLDDTDMISFNSDGNIVEFNPYVKLGYIPEDYRLYRITYGYGDTMAWLIYKNENEDVFRFDYFIADEGYCYKDNENHIYKTFTENNQTYYFYEAIKENSYSSLIWYNNGYAFCIDAQFPQDELVKIAESVVFPEINA